MYENLEISTCDPFKIQNGQIYPDCIKLCFGKSIRMKGAGPRSAVGNVSGYRCMSDCRSRAREFDPGLVPYFRGDLS